MTLNPQFTLITSTLNSAVTLERCLCSVESQVNASFEHLIADGASSDDTLAIVDSFAKQYALRLVCSSQDTGLYQAWNRAIDEARGEWILFLGSDDYLVSHDVLSRVAQILVRIPSLNRLSFLYGDTASPRVRPCWAKYQPLIWLNRLRGVTEFPNSVLINTDVFRQGHRFDESYRICADHKFFAQNHLFDRGAYIPITMISFQDGGISSNSDFNRVHYLERRRLLSDLGLSRPWYTEWYYWLRSHQLHTF